MRQLKETLHDQEKGVGRGEVFEFYSAAISRLYRRLLELYDAILSSQGGHVDTPRPNVHQPRSLANLDTEILSLYHVLESNKPTAKHKTRDAGKKLLGAEILSAQHRLRYLICERIRLEQQEEERRAVAAVSQGLFGNVRGSDGNGLFASSSSHSFAAQPPTTGTSGFTFDSIFTQGMMAPPTARAPLPMQHQPSLFRPTTQGATTSSSFRRPRGTYSSPLGPQGTFSTQLDQGDKMKTAFEQLAMRGTPASRGVEAAFGASSVPRGNFSSEASTTASTATHTPMTAPSFTFGEPASTLFSFDKATPSSAGSTGTFSFGAARSTDPSVVSTHDFTTTSAATNNTSTVGTPSFNEVFAGGVQSNTRDAFQAATALGAATCRLPSSLRFRTPGDTLNGSINSSRSDQAVGSVASSMSRFSMSSPAPRHESFSFAVTPKSSNSRSIKRNRN